LALVTPCVIGHSWVACTKYDYSGSVNDSQVYNPAKCSGWGRGWGPGFCQTTNTEFGVDCGYNFASQSPVCPTALSTNYASAYTTESPMATYAPGETVCLAWPAKNHVAASCINPDIPDHGLKVYMSQANPTADPSTLSTLQNSGTLVKDFGANTVADGMVGFQHCPLFCSNPDKCLCTGCFTIPTTVQEGAVYSFFWVWLFNSVSDTYTTCWEATISGAAQAPQTSAQTPLQTSAQTPAHTSAQTPAQTSAQTPAQTSAQTPAPTTKGQSPAQTPAQTSADSPSDSPSNSPDSTSESTSGCADANYCESVCGSGEVMKCDCTNGSWSVECLNSGGITLGLTVLVSIAWLCV